MDSQIYFVVLGFAIFLILAGAISFTPLGKRWLRFLAATIPPQDHVLSNAQQIFVRNSIQGAIVLDQHRRILEINPRVEIFTLTPASGLLGKSIESIFPSLGRGQHEDGVVFQQWLNGFDLTITVIPLPALQNAEKSASMQPSGWLVSLMAVNPALEVVTIPILDTDRNQSTPPETASEASAPRPDLNPRDSEERFRRLVDSVPMMIWIANTEAKFTYLNRSWLEFTGRSMDAELGDGWQECVQAEDRQSLLNLFAVAENAASGFSTEFQLRREDGVYRWIYCSVTPFMDEDGLISGYIGSGLDISEQKEREQQLRTFSMAVEQNPASIILTNPKGRIVYVNRRFVQVSGYSRMEVIGQAPSILKSGETPAHEYADLWKTVLAGGEWHGYFHNLRKNGELYWERATVSGIANAKGEIIYLLGIKEDITEQKLAEILLQESRASLEAIFDNPQLGIVLINKSGKCLQVNERFAQLMGYSSEEMLKLTILSITHLDDVAETRRQFNQVVNKEIPQFFLENRYVRKDGMVFWGSLSCTPVYQPDGSIRELIGFLADISGRRETAEKLSASEELYRSIIHASPDGIVITGMDGSIQIASPSAKKQWGYPEEADLVGIKMENLIWESDRAKVSKWMTLLISGLGPQILEAKGLRVDDSQFFFEAAIELMDADDEKPKRVVYITRDVSDRKRMEDTERQRIKDLETLRATMNDLAGELEQPKLYHAIVDRLLALVKAEVGGLGLYDETSQRITIKVSKGFSRDYTGVTLALGEELMGQVGQDLNTVIVDNYAAWEKRSPKFEAMPISMIGVPLLAGERLLGALTVGIDAKVHKFTEQDAHLIVLFAQQAAVALQNAELFSEVQRLAMIDPLTGVYNRRFFFERAQKELRRSMRYHSPMTMVMMDIDHFKLVNDRFGHPKGDEVLCSVANVCLMSTRNFDVLGRYGGEEFILLLPETGLDGALMMAERIRSDIERMEIASEHGIIQITISVGVSNLGPDNGDLDRMLSEADQALYMAKQGGRNRIEIFKAE